MSATQLLTGAISLAQLFLAVAIIFAAWRLLLGPRAQDRVLGLDTMYVNVTLLLITQGMRTGTALYFEVALAISLLGFVSTVALAKFLMRGDVIE